MALHSQKDLYSGLMFSIVGGAFAWGALDYEVGHAARMGPGYFPLMLGLILVLLGAAIAIKAFRGVRTDGDPIGAFAWRPLFFILMANVLFGVLLVGLPSIGLPGMGMLVAIFVMTIVASLAGKAFNVKEAALQGLVLAVGSYLVFVVGLNLQFPVLPAFFSH